MSSATQQLTSSSWPALGVTVQVLVDEPAALDPAVDVVRAEVTALDLACSRFRTDSEVIALPRAAGRPVPVSSLLAEAVRVALQAARATDGDVDPTLGATLAGLGYDRDFAALPADTLPAGPRLGQVRVRRLAGWKDVSVDPAGRVTVPAGVLLDLGATAKALGADRAAARVAATLGCGVLVNSAATSRSPARRPRVAARSACRTGRAAFTRTRTGRARPSRCTAAHWPPRAPPPGAGSAAVPRCTTCWTRGPACRPARRGERSRSRRRPASPRTPPARPRSSEGTGLCPVPAGPGPAGPPRGPGRLGRHHRRLAGPAREAGGVMTDATLWYLPRGTGVVALLLLTAVVVLGVLTRSSRPLAGLPRFVTAGMHRNLSLIAVCLLAVPVGTAVLDPYAMTGIVGVLLPFTGDYRPLWVGLGTLALDLLLALTATSLLRSRLSDRAWRGVHWAAYACWPLAVLHGLGSGTDVLAAWSLAVTALCVLAGAATVTWRVSSPQFRSRQVAVR